MLKLERQFASTETAEEPKKSLSESEDSGSRNEAAVEPKQTSIEFWNAEFTNDVAVEPEHGFRDMGNTGSGNEKSEKNLSRKKVTKRSNSRIWLRGQRGGVQRRGEEKKRPLPLRVWVVLLMLGSANKRRA